MKIKLAGIVKESVVDGPGLRWVLFVQGCPHRCEGCHNAQAQDPTGGYETTTEEVIRQLPHNPLIRGLTFSGGEPFQQPEALVEIGREAKKRGLTLFIYSGYRYEELQAMVESKTAIKALLELTDVLVDGPFIIERKDLNLAYRGSANQRLIDVPRSLQAGYPVEWGMPDGQ